MSSEVVDKPYAILVRTHTEPDRVQVWDRYYCREDGELSVPDAKDDPDVAVFVGLRRHDG